jgi:hypothetical protein
MKIEEIRKWFDKAFEYLLKGEFISAGECFQYVIDHSNDGYARGIARRDKEWWCTPVSHVIKRLREIPHPIPITELVAELENKVKIENPKQFLTALQNSLTELKLACKLDDFLWVHKKHLYTDLEKFPNLIRRINRPITLFELAQRLFTDKNYQLPVTATVQSYLKNHLNNIPGLIVLETSCVSTSNILDQFSRKLINRINKTKSPTHLSSVLDDFDWPAIVIENLKIEGLNKWLRRYNKKSRLLEIGSGYWFLNDIIDLSKIDISQDFQEPYGCIDTEDILRRYIFPLNPEIIPQKKFLNLQTKYLLKNPSLIKLETNKWISIKSFEFLIQEIFDKIAQSDRPKTHNELLIDLSDNFLRNDQLLVMIEKSITKKFEQSNDIVCVFGKTYLHRNAFSSVLDRAYNFLLENGPHITTEVLEQSLGILLHGRKCKENFYEEFEKEILSDERFIRLARKNQWIAIPSGNRINNLAYTILYDKHIPLSNTDLSRESKIIRGRSVRFKLYDDDRFKQSTDNRWMLANWILINDMAAAYLAGEKIALKENQILEKISELHDIEISVAVFCPLGDQRFKRDPWGRWQCDSAGVLLTEEMLNKLVYAASNDLEWGVSLKRLTKYVFNKPPTHFYNLEKTIIDDDRLIYCEGLWYPKEFCLEKVNAEQIIQIKSYLENKKYPVSGVELAKACLNKPICLTDLEDVLETDSEVVRIGGSGWTVIENMPESIGRRRLINYPIKSGKYIPSFKYIQLAELESDSQIINNGVIAGSSTNMTSKPKRPNQITLTLVFEDIRDGTIVISSKMRKFLDASIEYEALKFIDKNGNELICWCDLENDLIYGFSEWFKINNVGFGDKIRLSLDDDANFLIEVIGERNEQVYKESLRRSQIEDLRNEAKLVNLSYHDITLNILDYFKAPLHIDDIWELVDHKRIAKRSTINSILSGRPYFIPKGEGYWQFDEEEYAKMISQLETQIKKLKKKNKKLQDEFKTILKEGSVSEELKAQIGLLKEEIESMQKNELDFQSKIDKIAKERDSLNLLLSDRETELDNTKKDLLNYQNQNKLNKSESDDLKSKLQKANEQLSALSNENQILGEKLKNESLERNKIKENLLDKEKMNNELNLKLEEKEADLRALQGSLENSDKLKIQAESKQKELNLDIDNLKSINTKLELELEGIRQQADALQNLNVNLNDKINNLEQECQNALSEQKSLNSKFKNASDTNNQLQAQLDLYSNKISTLTERIQKFDAKLEADEKEKKQLKDSVYNLEQKLINMDKEKVYAYKIINSPLGKIAKWWVKLKN